MNGNGNAELKTELTADLFRVTTEKRICQNCRAWEQSDATCRRKSASGDGYFPVADADQWCWEFV